MSRHHVCRVACAVPLPQSPHALLCSALLCSARMRCDAWTCAPGRQHASLPPPPLRPPQFPQPLSEVPVTDFFGGTATAGPTPGPYPGLAEAGGGGGGVAAPTLRGDSAAQGGGGRSSRRQGGGVGGEHVRCGGRGRAGRREGAPKKSGGAPRPTAAATVHVGLAPPAHASRAPDGRRWGGGPNIKNIDDCACVHAR